MEFLQLQIITKSKTALEHTVKLGYNELGC